jgi:hypothetical protein
MRAWYDGFVERHRELGHRTSAAVKKVRLDAQGAEENIVEYFNYLSEYKDLPPSQVYAADETGLDGDGSRTPRVLAPVGMKRPSQQQDSYREHTSLLHIANAAGTTLPMIVIFKGKEKADLECIQQLAELAPDAQWGAQESGYFIGEHFMDVLSHFEKHATSKRPLLFIMDGAKAHVDDRASQWAKSRDIHILLLPSNLTHLLQVADLSVFRPFKQFWKNECRQLKSDRTRMGRVTDRSIRKTDIIPLVVRAWGKAMTAKNVKAGFKLSGIYPFDPHAYKKNETKHLQSLSGLPLLLTPTEEILATSQSIPSIVSSLPLVTPAAKGGRCGECGRSGKKRVARPTLSTKKGLLMTGEAALAIFRAQADFDRVEAEAKAKKAEEAMMRKQAKAEEKEQKVKARGERERLREQKVVAEAPTGGRTKKSRKRKAPLAASDAEVMGDEVKEKENVDVNLPPPLSTSPRLLLHPLMTVCYDAPFPSLPLLPPSPPSPLPSPVTTHSHETRHALRMMR